MPQYIDETPDVKESFISKDNYHILYDGNVAFDSSWFDRDALRQNGMAGEETSTGRAPALFFQAGEREYLLKTYRRGGMFGRLINQLYLYTGVSRTRAFSEWRILALLRKKRLPVPRPIAATYRHVGTFYTAELITESCRPALSLSQYLAGDSLPDKSWVELGKLLHHLHLVGVLHPDLNAHNILYNKENNQFWLIDFDRSRIKSVDPTYYTQHANLARLRRSLEKLSSQKSSFKYAPDCFDKLSEGYGSVIMEA